MAGTTRTMLEPVAVAPLLMPGMFVIDGAFAVVVTTAEGAAAGVVVKMAGGGAGATVISTVGPGGEDTVEVVVPGALPVNDGDH